MLTFLSFQDSRVPGPFAELPWKALIAAAAATAAVNKGEQPALCAGGSIFRHKDKWMQIYTICHVSSFVLCNRDVCLETVGGQREVMYSLWQA